MTSIQQKKDLALNLLDKSSYLGPTQIRCLVNNSTKGRGWTLKEKQKASMLRSMCTKKCYDYVRKNIVPLPSTWELNSCRHDTIAEHIEDRISSQLVVSADILAKAPNLEIIAVQQPS